MEEFTISLSLIDSRTMMDVLQHFEYPFDMKIQRDKKNYYFSIELESEDQIFSLGRTYEEYKHVNDRLEKENKSLEAALKKKNLAFSDLQQIVIQYKKSVMH